MGTGHTSSLPSPVLTTDLIHYARQAGVLHNLDDARTIPCSRDFEELSITIRNKGCVDFQYHHKHIVP